MSAESAHLSTFGAETETEAEIRSTSSCKFCRYDGGLKVEEAATETAQYAGAGHFGTKFKPYHRWRCVSSELSRVRNVPSFPRSGGEMC